MAQCASVGSAKAWAIAQGVSPNYVSQVLKGRVPPGPKILEGLRLERIVTFVPVRDKDPAE